MLFARRSQEGAARPLAQLLVGVAVTDTVVPFLTHVAASFVPHLVSKEPETMALGNFEDLQRVDIAGPAADSDWFSLHQRCLLLVDAALFRKFC